MKVGTDGVLLGAWTQPENANSIADLGAGTGLLTLMLAQKCSADIVAFEKDPSAAEQCRRNLQESPWSNRLTLICADVFTMQIEGMFDWVICNPPFHEEKFLSPKAERILARTAQVGIDQWFSFAWKISQHRGKASFILPANREESYLNAAQNYGWHLEKICRVIPSSGKRAVRIMIQMCKMPVETDISELILEGEQRGDYTKEYQMLCKDYYLNF